MGERTYTTSNGSSRASAFTARDAELDVRIKKVTMTDEGKLAVALECEIPADDEQTLEQVKNLLTALHGPVSASFTPRQAELDV